MWGDDVPISPALFPENHNAIELFGFLNPRSGNLGVEAVQLVQAFGFSKRDLDKVLRSCVPIWRKLNANTK